MEYSCVESGNPSFIALKIFFRFRVDALKEIEVSVHELLEFVHSSCSRTFNAERTGGFSGAKRRKDHPCDALC